MGAGPAADYTLWMAGEAPVGGLMKQPEEAAKMGAPPSWLAVLRDPQGAVFAVMRSANPMPEENDPQPLEFSWHELVVTDAVSGLEFYKTLFGWEKKAEHDMGPMGAYHMFGRDRFTYGGTYDKPAEMPASYWLHYVRVKDSADAAADRAKAAGAQVLAGPMEVPGGDRIAVIMDPQGAAFAVHSK